MLSSVEIHFQPASYSFNWAATKKSFFKRVQATFFPNQTLEMRQSTWKSNWNWLQTDLTLLDG